jgi:hypothetical protein
MILNIKNHFLKINQKRFIVISVVLLLLLDLINSYYLRLYWDHKNLSLLYVEKLAQTQGLDFKELGQQSVLEIKQVINNGFFFFLFIILINNLFFYLFYLRKKLWAQGYVIFYAITNSILSALFLFEGPIMGIPWFIYNLLAMGVYFYLYVGMKLLKIQGPLSHEHEKMAQ